MIRTYSSKLGEVYGFDQSADPETVETIVESILQHTQLTDLEKTTYFLRESHHINAKYSFFNRLFKDVYYAINHPFHNLNRAKNNLYFMIP